MATRVSSDDTRFVKSNGLDAVLHEVQEEQDNECASDYVCSSIECQVLEQGKWKARSLSTQSLNEPKTFLAPSILFLDHAAYRHEHICHALHSYFKLPPYLLRAEHVDSNGAYGSKSHFNEDDGRLEAHFKTFSLSNGVKSPTYSWSAITFYTHWRPLESQQTPETLSRSPRAPTLICFELPPELRTKFMDTIRLSDLSSITCDPYGWIPSFMPVILGLYDVSVWRLRHTIRSYETARSQSEQDFPLLHEGARHAIHATETLTLACGNLKALLEEQNPSNVALSIYRNINAARRVAQDLNFYYSRLCAFKARSESNLARVQNEIGLAFNVVAQRDTKITLELSRNATQDSRIMRQISFVTLIFLPGTAVSTLFSTSFFNFSPPSPANNNSNTSNEPNNQTGVWQVSDKFWIFWVITIPLTLATYMTWQWFQRGIDVTEFPVGSARGKVEDQVAPKNKWDRFRDIMPMAGFTDRKTRRAGSEENRDGPEDAGITTTRERRGGLDAARSYFGKRKAAGGEGEKEREKEDEQVV